MWSQPLWHQPSLSGCGVIAYALYLQVTAPRSRGQHQPSRALPEFESRYLDGLIGRYPEERDVYVDRSPIHHVDRLSSPLIVFQGLEDKVVPPDQAEMIVDALRGRGVPVEYLTFEGEQHGFRKAESIIRV